MNRKYPLTPEEFKAVYSKVPRLCVDLIVETERGILLTLREKNGFLGLWHLPGGTVYYREHTEDSVRRLAREELGVDVKILKFLRFLEYFSEEEQRGFGYSVSLVFVCKAKSLDFTLDDQAVRAQFFKVIPKNSVSEQKEMLNEFLTRKSI